MEENENYENQEHVNHDDDVTEELSESRLGGQKATRGNESFFGIKVETQNGIPVLPPMSEEEIQEELRMMAEEKGKKPLVVNNTVKRHTPILKESPQSNNSQFVQENFTAEPNPTQINTPIVAVKDEKFEQASDLSKDFGPIKLLVDKSKKEESELSVQLKINNISPQFFGILKNTFEDSEDTILEILLQSMDLKDIKQQIKQQLKAKLNNEQ